MPYELKEADGRYCVHKQGDETPLKCYSSKSDAENYLAALYTNVEDARHIHTTRAVYLTNEALGEVSGYVFIWGSLEARDSYQTWFDKARPPAYSYRGDLVGYPLCYEHGSDSAIGKEHIGSITRTWFDDIGLAFEGQLDRSSPFFERIISELRSKQLYTSSSSADHMCDWREDGSFAEWTMNELSFTKDPAESRIPAVSLLRSQGAEQPRDAAGDDGQRPIESSINQQEGTTMPNAQEAIAQLPADADLNAILAALTAAGYSLDDIMAAIQQQAPPAEMSAPGALPEGGRSINFAQVAAMLETQKAQREAAALRSEMDAVKAQMAAMVAEPPPQNGHQVRTSEMHTDITVSEDRKYWGRSLPDLMFAYEVLKARGKQASPDFLRTIAGRTAVAIEKREELVFNPAVRSLLPAVRADEIVTSTNVGNGDEWIGVAYSGTLWEKARNNRIFQALVSKGMRVEEVPQGHESTVIFTEGADPTVYTITQSADLDATLRPTVVVPVTAPGTGQVVLTPGYLGMAVAYTSVFEEDSLIAAASQFNTQMNEKAEETIEQLFINGDTATSLNVNLDGGTPTTQYYLASNGARKYAIVTGGATVKRDGGALDENDYRLTLKLFSSAIRTRKQQIAFIIDSDTHNTSLGILALKTADVRNAAATIDSGVLENIWGVDVLESGFLPLADTDGKVTSGGNVADTGTILGVYAPFWAMGWKRRVTIETQKDILAQSNLIVATFRLGFVPRGVGAAVASYNLTIA